MVVCPTTMRERPHWLVQETQHVGYVRAAIKHIADNDNVAFAKRPLHFAINDSIRPHQPRHGIELPCMSLSATSF